MRSPAALLAAALPESNPLPDWISRMRSTFLLLAATLSVVPLHAQDMTAGQSEKQRTVYRGATLIDGTGAAVRSNMDIVVEGETIVRVSPVDGTGIQPGTQLVDAANLFVLPGLIDSHVHLATPPEQTRAKASLRRYLYSGITAVRSMADDVRPVAELAREALTAEIPSPDIYYTALMAGPDFFDDPRTIAVTRGGIPGQVPWMQAITEDTDLVMAVAMARGTSASAIKLYANLPATLVEHITREAKRQGIKVWAHSAVFPALPGDNVRAGVDVMSHVCPIGYEVSKDPPRSYQQPTPVEIAPFADGDNPRIGALFRAMKQQGIVLDATVRVQLESATEFASTGRGRPPRCSPELTYQLTAQAYREGVLISTGTDGDTEWQSPYPALHEELELLVNKAGMPPLQAIRSATQVGALALGLEQQMGTVAPGKLANLVFVTKDPLQDIGNLRSVAFTVKRGVVYPRAKYVAITAEEQGNP